MTKPATAHCAAATARGMLVLGHSGGAVLFSVALAFSASCSEAPLPQQPLSTAGTAGVPDAPSIAPPPSASGQTGASSAGAAGRPDAPSSGQAGSGAKPQAAGNPLPAASDAAANGGTDAGASMPQTLPDAASEMPDAVAPTLPPCPTSSTYTAGDNPGMLQLQDRMRRYSVYVPSSIEASVRVPLVLDFHGNGGSGAQEQSSSGWQQKADREGFIVAYPDGVGNGWNVGNCCGEALSEMIDDVGFARMIVAAISGQACIDPKRVYATGLSNGAGLSHRLACEAADVFAAIAAASADLVTDPCTPARPISELSIRGESDTLVAYEGGNTGSTGWYSPGAKGTLDLWKDIDGCTGTPETKIEYCETYTQCKAGVEVTLCSLPGTGHILYDNALNFDVPEQAWEMFKRQPMP